MIIDIPNNKTMLKAYIEALIDHLDKKTYPEGKRGNFIWLLQKAREKLRKMK